MHISGFCKKTALWLIVCFLLEVFVFNLGHWTSLGFPKAGGDDVRIRFQEGLVPAPEAGEDVYLAADPEMAVIELYDLDCHVENLVLDLYRLENGAPVPGDAVSFHLNITDEANSVLRPLPSSETVCGIEESRYIRLHLAGDSSTIEICPEVAEGTLLHIGEPALNRVRPFYFHLKRLLLLFLAGAIVIGVTRPATDRSADRASGPAAGRAAGRVTGTGTLTHEPRVSVPVPVALLLLSIALTSGAVLSTRPDTAWPSRGLQQKEYELLGNALAKGHTWLDEPVPESLVQMENPYDYYARSLESYESGDYYLIDTSYYNGKYYVYFGVTPALLFFLPFRLLTGHVLPTWLAVLFSAALFDISAFFLMFALVRKYFPDADAGLVPLLALTLAAGSGALFLSHFATTYTMPMICGLMLGAFGLGLWLSAERPDGTYRKGCLVAGAVLIALIIGCRPQFAIITLFAFAIFAGGIRNGAFFRPRKDSLINTLCVIVPFLLIGCGMLYYNYVRFDSPFEFGIRYLLTISDMNHRVLTPAKNGMGLVLHLLQPLHIVPQYPFIAGIDWVTQYQGDLYIEPQTGGFFAFNLIALLCFALFHKRVRAVLRESGALALALSSLAAALLVCELDILLAGLSQRYQADYAFLFMISAVLVILALEKMLQGHTLYPAFRRVIILLCFACIFLNTFSLLSDGRYLSLRGANPYLFYLVKYRLFRF